MAKYVDRRRWFPLTREQQARVRRPSFGVTRNLARAFVAIVVAIPMWGGVATLDGAEAQAASSVFVGSNPTRIRDTRDGPGPYRRGALGDGKVLTVGVGTNRPVVVNLSAVSPSGAGYLTAYPCGAPRPTASVLNFQDSVTANLAIVTPNAAGEVCVYARVSGGGSVHVVVDKYGVLAGSVFTGMVAERRLDTRRSGGKVGANRSVQVTGLKPHASVVVNLAVTQPEADGWLSGFPCAEGFGGTSSLNYVGNEIRSGLAVVRADADGTVCIRSSTRAHVIADVMGTFRSSQAADIIAPARVGDTRSNRGISRGQSFRFDFDAISPTKGATLKGRGRAVIMNIAAVNPAATGHLVVWPCSKRRPTTSALNFSAGRLATSNPVIVQPDSTGTVCMWASSPTDLVVDIGGFLNTSAPGSSDTYEPRTDCARGSIAFINTERSRLGRGALVWNEAQFPYACAWAHRMAYDDYLRHWGWGTPYPFGGENIAVGPSSAWMENRWMNSALHHDNIIGANYLGTTVAYVNNVLDGQVVYWGVNQFTN